MVVADAPPRPRATPRTAPAGRGPRGDARWIDTGVLAVGLLAAFAGLRPLLQGAGWWFFGLAIVVLALGVAAIVRRALGRGWAGPLAGLVAGTLVLVPAFAGDTTIAGLVPTADTWDRAGLLVRRGLASIQEQSIPADPVPGILFLMMVPLLLVTVAADLIVLEAELPALAAFPLFGLVAVPVAVQEGVSDAYTWIVVLAAYLVLLRRGLPRSPRPLTLIAGAVVVLGSLAVPLVLPPTAEKAVDTPLGLGTHANPLIDLGTDLRRPAPVEAIRYTTKDGARPYLRLATLSDFRGDVWAPEEDLPRLSSLDNIPAADGVSSAVARRTRTVSITVLNVGGRWLPLPYPATRIEGVTGNWSVEPLGLTARSDFLSADGQRYRVSYSQILPTREQLAASGTRRQPNMERYLDVPPGVDPIVASTARRITRDAPTNWAKAVALQAYFRGQFTYSEQAPVDEGYDGSGVGVLGDFLRAKAGYCVHFSSAMTIMARQLGIPSRQAVGYMPGEVSSRGADGEITYSVSSRSLHSWPELYFPEVGWTRFEPTASRGDVPAYSTPASDDPADQPTGQQATTAPSASPAPTPTTAPNIDEDPQDTRRSTSSAAERIAPVALGWTGGVLGLVLVLLVPAGVRRGIRRARYVRVDSGRGGAEAAWEELRDTARDVGWLAPPTETVRDFALRLETALPDQTEVLERLRAEVETEAYGRWRGTGVDSADLRALVAALMRTVGPRDRIRAVLLPPSLLGRVSSALAPS